MVSTLVPVAELPLVLRRSLRMMRGQTQAQLVETEYGHAYVTKFGNNPLGPRVLASEWMGSLLMRQLGLPVPSAALIIARPAEYDVHNRCCTEPIARLHFGSSYPGDPSTDAVYDFIPDPLLSSIQHQNAFAGACVFDIWVANTDMRQAVFYRERNSVRSLSVLFIDNSHLFGGPDWTFEETDMTGRYMSASAYRNIQSWNSFCPWLQRIEQMSKTDTVWLIANSIPEEWLCGRDRHSIERIAEELLERSRNLGERIAAHVRSRHELFPNWKPNSRISVSPADLPLG
jgi:hypothetical protein